MRRITFLYFLVSFQVSYFHRFSLLLNNLLIKVCIMPFDYAATNQNTNAPYIYIEQTEMT